MIGSPRNSQVRHYGCLPESPSKLSINTGSALNQSSLPLTLRKNGSFSPYQKILQLDGSSHELLLSPSARTGIAKSPMSKDSY